MIRKFQAPGDLAPAVVLSHGTGGLGAVRSLGRKGIQVTAIAFDEEDLVLHSRYAARKFCLHGRNVKDKEATLLSILRTLPDEGAVVLTTSDQLVAFVDTHREELQQKFRFRLLPSDVLDMLNDKSKETQFVRSLGFAIPKTVQALPGDPAQLQQQLRLPIIFKPHSYSVQEIFPHKNAIVRNQGELEEFYSEWHHALPALLAQEIIPGPDSASWICSGTYDLQHELLDCGIKQKLRAFPAHFGGSSCAISRNNDEIMGLARNLGRKLEYVGHAGIEFRWDERDREYKYIELNPRMPANVGFDEACGLPTVWNSYKVSLDGKATHSGRHQKDGIYYLDLKGDFYSLRADRTPLLRIFVILLALVLFKRTNGLFFAWDDPKPGLAGGWRFLLHLCGSAWTKATSTGKPLKQS
jgi:D-aspartate ligase